MQDPSRLETENKYAGEMQSAQRHKLDWCAGLLMWVDVHAGLACRTPALHSAATQGRNDAQPSYSFHNDWLLKLRVALCRVSWPGRPVRLQYCNLGYCLAHFAFVPLAGFCALMTRSQNKVGRFRAAFWACAKRAFT